jgi:Fur family transcriptional regulator, peroxide stress response regulator
MERCRRLLKQHGIKQTQQRLQIFHELAGRSDHPSAEEVYHSVRQRIPALALDTVYRTLWLMIDLGLVSTLGPSREPMRFDANMDLHHHFICTACGMARDFYSAEYNQLAAPRAARALGQVSRVQVGLLGLCAKCSGPADH